MRWTVRRAGLVALALTLAAAMAVTACGRAKRGGTGLSERVVPLGQPVPKGGGRYKVGEPYKINGRWYHPHEYRRYDKIGTASWYGELFHGRRTANGEIYDMTALTAAHPTLPMPTYARVTNLANGRTIVVRVNDRGPYAHDRIIDLSARSAELLGFKRNGTAPVRVTYLGHAPLNGDDSYERRVLASQPWARYAGVAPGPAAVGVAAAADPVVVGSLARSDGKGSLSPPERGTMPRHSNPATGPDVEQEVIFVQAGSFRNKDNAERIRARLADLGPVEMATADVAGATYYRVRLGPFIHRAVADEALARAVSAGAVGARLVAR